MNFSFELKSDLDVGLGGAKSKETRDSVFDRMLQPDSPAFCKQALKGIGCSALSNPTVPCFLAHYPNPASKSLS